MVLIESNGQRAAFPADLMPTAAHLSLAWIAAVDQFPLETLASKQAFVEERQRRSSFSITNHGFRPRYRRTERPAILRPL